jgi:hypothetical protein
MEGGGGGATVLRFFVLPEQSSAFLFIFLFDFLL